MKHGFMNRRNIIKNRLVAILGKYSPKETIDIDVLDDSYTCLVEGGVILERSLQDNTVLANQILSYRRYLKLLFNPD